MTASENPAGTARASTKLPDIPALTGLRIFAALFVVISHSLHFGRPDQPSGIGAVVYDYVGSLSALGMSLFFVLSGFVIHYNYRAAILSGSPTGYWNFFVARFSRLYPLFFGLMVFDMWRVGIFDGLFNGNTAITKNVQQSAPYYLTLTQAWFFDIIGENNYIYSMGVVGGIAWSISTEWFFYLAYPLICILTLMAPKAWMKVALGAIVSVVALVVLIYVIEHGSAINAFGERYWGTPAGDQLGGQDSLFRWVIYFSPYSRIFEFILGVVTCDFFLRVREQEPSAGERRIGLWLTLGSILAIVILHGLMFEPQRRFQMLTQLHKSFGYAIPVAVLLFCVARYSTPIARFLTAKPLVLGGEISYSTYLWHIIILHSAVRYGVFDWVSDPTLVIFFKVAVGVGVTLLVGFFSYKWLEVPARNWLRTALAVSDRPRPAWFAFPVGATRALVIALLFALPMLIVQFNHPPVPNPPPDGTINIVDASFGTNCGVAPGNVTSDAQQTCAGLKSCTYVISIPKIGDPAGGCGKEFSLTYACGKNSPLMGAIVPAPAEDHGIALSCLSQSAGQSSGGGQ